MRRRAIYRCKKRNDVSSCTLNVGIIRINTSTQANTHTQMGRMRIVRIIMWRGWEILRLVFDQMLGRQTHARSCVIESRLLMLLVVKPVYGRVCVYFMRSVLFETHGGTAGQTHKHIPCVDYGSSRWIDDSYAYVWCAPVFWNFG